MNSGHWQIRAIACDNAHNTSDCPVGPSWRYHQPVNRCVRLRVSAVLMFSFALLPHAAGQSHEGCGTSRPDCDEAISFFVRLQNAIRSDKRTDVASLVRYPLRVTLHRKKVLIRNRKDLVQNYRGVFDNAVRCAIENAKRSDVWGNWRGFTVDAGPVWWEKSTADSPFLLIAVNNEAFYPGCGTGNKGEQPQ